MWGGIPLVGEGLCALPMMGEVEILRLRALRSAQNDKRPTVILSEADTKCLRNRRIPHGRKIKYFQLHTKD